MRRAVARGIAAVIAAGAAGVAPLSAQTLERYTADTVVSFDMFGGENVSNRPQIVVDASSGIRLGDHWQLLFRPWFRKARPSAPGAAAPEWDAQLYQAAARYERPGRVATRVDVGQIVSPIGLGNLDWRPNLNPTIVPHLTYVVSMPAFDPTVPRVTPVAQNYPLGTQVTLSTERWDARAALVNVAPTRGWAIGADNNAAQTPVVEGGAGVTPVIGMRLGLALARGKYATHAEAPFAGPDGQMMTLVGGEAEYAFGYTKLTGELTRTAFQTASTSAVAYEYFVQGTHTITPRIFAAARNEGSSAPAAYAGAFKGQRTRMKMIEATVGYRFTPEITLRSSYYARHPYTAPTWDQQIGVSIVIARRWR
jgi:hypothetical protein